MEFLQTSDGSWTLFSPQHQEHFKSRHAAREEAQEVFYRPGVLEHPHYPHPLRILELGFGLGTNFSLLKEKQFQGSFLSIDRDFAPAIQFTGRFPDPELENLLQNRVWETFGFHAELREGEFLDALFALQEEKKRFHTIFFDPFSPRSNPEAWSQEIFTAAAHCLEPQGRLVTYSVARIAKDHAAVAGLRVSKRKNPPILRKKASLLAIKPELTEP